MDRRLFISSVGCGAVVAALAATAQVPGNLHRPRHVGWMQTGGPDTPDQEQQENDALAEVGWIVGQNVLIDRSHLRLDDLPRAAQDFVNAKVDLIVADGTAATLAAKNATTTIPILMWAAANPVASGLVASLARPGGNITGCARLEPELSIKRLSLLRECLPGIRRVGTLEDPANPGLRIVRGHIEEAYRSLGLEPIFADVRRFRKFDDVVAELVQRHAQALDILNDTLFLSWAKPEVFGAVVRFSLPTSVDNFDLLEAGALLSYEIDSKELYHSGAVLFDKLLRGANPADLPVVQPTKFILGINLRTAKVLGLAIPRALLLRADRMIQ